jgi:hypothetical protein
LIVVQLVDIEKRKGIILNPQSKFYVLGDVMGLLRLWTNLEKRANANTL